MHAGNSACKMWVAPFCPQSEFTRKDHVACKVIVWTTTDGYRGPSVISCKHLQGKLLIKHLSPKHTEYDKSIVHSNLICVL